jgi:hypothetical protein
MKTIRPLWAIRAGSVEPVRLLADAGANTRTSLIIFAADAPRDWPGTTDAVRVLPDHGAPVDAATQGGPWNGETALFQAAGHGNAPLVALLLEKGADPNRRLGDAGHTPLLSGAGYPEVARILLEHGAKINAADNYGGTATIFAAMAAVLRPSPSSKSGADARTSRTTTARRQPCFSPGSGTTRFRGASAVRVRNDDQEPVARPSASMASAISNCPSLSRVARLTTPLQLMVSALGSRDSAMETSTLSSTRIGDGATKLTPLTPKLLVVPRTSPTVMGRATL